MSSAAIATLIGAVVALGVGIYGFFHRRKITAQRATIEFILQYEIHSPGWLESLSAFNSMPPHERMATFMEDNLPSDKRSILINYITILNHYEMVAVGIERKVLDELVYKEWFRQPYVAIWRKAQSCVIEWRKIKEQPKAFIKFEQLATRWEKETV